MKQMNKYIEKMKKRGKRGVRNLVSLLLLLLGCMAGGSLRYYSFVSETVYEESVSHLGVIYHQTNQALNTLVDQNMTYLHMWSVYLRTVQDEGKVRTYLGKAKEVHSRRTIVS